MAQQIMATKKRPIRSETKSDNQGKNDTEPSERGRFHPHQTRIVRGDSPQ